MRDDDPGLLETALLIAIGGAVGAVLRHGVGVVLGEFLGTVVVNVLGATLLGVVLYRAIGEVGLRPRLELLAATGFLSSFTTYSTFVLEAVTAGVVVGGGYVLVTYGLGLAGVLLGRQIVRHGWGLNP